MVEMNSHSYVTYVSEMNFELEMTIRNELEMKSLNELPIQEHIKYLKRQKEDIEKSKYLTPHQFRTWKYLKNEIEKLERKMNERMEMKWTIDQFEGLGNETKSKNEPEMNEALEMKNDLEMNDGNELEMKRGNEPEMNNHSAKKS